MLHVILHHRQDLLARRVHLVLPVHQDHPDLLARRDHLVVHAGYRNDLNLYKKLGDICNVR
jgi:hypothetical protein